MRQRAFDLCMAIAQGGHVNPGCFRSGDVREMLLEALTPACNAERHEPGLAEYLGWPLRALNQFFIDPTLIPFYSDFALGQDVVIKTRVRTALYQYARGNVPLPAAPKKKKSVAASSTETAVVAGKKPEGKYSSSSSAAADDKDGDDEMAAAADDAGDFAFDDKVRFFFFLTSVLQDRRVRHDTEAYFQLVQFDKNVIRQVRACLYCLHDGAAGRVDVGGRVRIGRLRAGFHVQERVCCALRRHHHLGV